MQRYIMRRLILAIPTFILASSLVFSMIRMMPGDVLFTLLEESLVNMPLTEIDKVKKEFGFDKPIYYQYGVFLGGVMTGNLGTSLRDREPVMKKIISRLPITFELAILAQMISLSIAIPIGVISAIRQDTFLDYFLRSLAILKISVPSFWLGTLAVVLPAIYFNWIPPMVYTPLTVDPATNLKQFIIPATILGLGLAGRVMRMVRTMMLEVMRQDYIRTAWAKGLKEQTIIYRHALKNALIPVVTVVGLEIAVLIGGTVVVESIFSLPGMGRLFIEALTFRDYPVIQGVNVVVSLWVILINLLVDISYAFLDPRIRYD
ncbi:MAG: glutathione transporter permease GsiC [Dehalococcoidia bacterium]|nr:glutathione transporter permease GsiC [Dehalococcoidia bacterium]